MTPASFVYGMHLDGPTHSVRMPVDWAKLKAAAAACSPSFDPNREGYLSAFRYDRAILIHLKANGGSSAGFTGSVWSDVLHFDFDAANNLDDALTAGRKLAT